MLVEHLDNWHKYTLGPTWEGVMTWLGAIASNPTAVRDGIHTVCGCAVNVVSTVSRVQSECRYEYHRTFCDVQMVLDGQEWFFHTPATGLKEDGAFDFNKDVGFFLPVPVETTRLTLRPGTFALVFPWEAHLPAIAQTEPAPLRKCIAKIPLDALTL